MLEGEHDAEPTRLRTFSSAMAPGGAVIGQGSFTLELLRSQASFENVHLEMRTSPSAFALVRFSRPLPTPSAVPLSAFVSTRSGGAHLDFVSPSPSTELRHFIAVISPVAAGSELFFGIEFGPDQLVQASLPLGLQPFRVATDVTGSYGFSVSNGTIPAGLAADLVAIVLTSPAAVATTPIRVVF